MLLSTEQIFLLARENLRPPKRFKTSAPWGGNIAKGDGSRACPRVLIPFITSYATASLSETH